MMNKRQIITTKIESNWKQFTFYVFLKRWWICSSDLAEDLTYVTSNPCHIRYLLIDINYYFSRININFMENTPKKQLREKETNDELKWGNNMASKNVPYFFLEYSNLKGTSFHLATFSSQNQEEEDAMEGINCFYKLFFCWNNF